MAAWDRSMDGVPWTPSKMQRAVKVLRPGASVSFAFHAEPLERLALLDDKVFRRRPDLVLHVWSTSASNHLDDAQVAALAALSNVRQLKIIGVKRAGFGALAGMHALESLGLSFPGSLDLSFVLPLSNLRTLALRAKLADLGPLAKLERLDSLALEGTLADLTPLAGCKVLSALRFGSSTIPSLDCLAELSKLRNLALDSTTVTGQLNGIGQTRGLADLSITANKNLRDLDFIARLTRLERLRIDQPLVVTLPDLSKLTKLTTISCRGMKQWENPEVLGTLPTIREIELQEINPKLTADRFFFLADPKKFRTLEKLDVRWIDFAKKRRAALHAHFVTVGRTALLA